MLKRITIQNFALIDNLEIELSEGLQVITGETGAGKSIILGALRLILGERADIKSICNHEAKSVVEAEFYMPTSSQQFFEENDLDFEQNTIIRREILPTGKSRAFVNDVPVTLDILKELSEQLIDIHSQFETSQLFSEEYQFKIIDGLTENKYLINNYQQDFQHYQKLEKQLTQLKNQLSEGNKQSDYQAFLLQELEAADIDDIDYENLQNQVKTAENSGLILENLNWTVGKLTQEELGILDSIRNAKTKIQKLAELSPNFEELNLRLEQSYLELKDIASSLEEEVEKVEVNPEVFAQFTQQLNTINSLMQKHQVLDIDALKEIKNQLSGQQKGFAEIESYITEIEKELSAIQLQLNEKSLQLSENRKKAIPVFVDKIESLLAKLGLEKAKVEVQLSESSNYTQFGKEKIQLLFQANSGFPLQPIQNAISGGERSRVMMAIKKIVAENSELPTLILDEIDTGVSGRIAEEMGFVMQEMAKNMQLIVITHLAQVAAKGNNNYKVTKQEINGKTQSNIISLSEDEKLVEIAQLLSGSKITDAALQQAKELMN